MDAQRFLSEFGHIANAPSGILRLRELVLSLAMQGKLVPQYHDESPADVLLEQIGVDKKKLIKSGAIKSPKPLPEITTSNVIHALPAKWTWVRFGDIALHNSGKTLDSGRNSGQPRDYITTSNLYWGRFELNNVRQMLIRDDELEKCTARKNDLLICEGGEAGRAAVWDSNYEVCFQNHIHRARFYGGINPFFAYRFFEKLNSTGEINQHRKGIGISNMSSKALAMIPFPLPPLKEQSRIVARVDELMALFDKLETQQQQRRSLQNNLRQSTLHAVAATTSPHELQTTWTRLAENFGQLFHEPEDVADLRKLISELTIRGAFDTSSEPTDITTVEVYLSEIGNKKSGKRFAKAVQVEEEISLPNGWRWVLLEELLAGSESGWSPKCDAEPRRTGEWGVLKVSAVTWGTFNPDENKRLPPLLDPRPECEVKPGDYILSRANTAELVARSVIVPDDCPEQLLMSDKIVRLNFLDNALKPWVNLVNNSEFSREYYKARATGTSDSMRNVSRQVIHELPIPLPSLQVQQRILGVLARLMRFCDELEQQASARKMLAEQFSTTAIANITGIVTKYEEDEPVKVPPTELIAPLRLGKAPDIKAQAPLATILTRHNGQMGANDLWQRFGGEIDAFYAQLKTEIVHGWIADPTYDLEDKSQGNPKSYPDGKYVAKMVVKEQT